MFKDSRIFRRTLFFILFLLSVLIFALLAGCGGSANMPSASILTSGQVTLMWQDVSGAATYNLYLSTAPGVTVMNSYKISDVTNPITITDLEPGNTYYFVVTVVDASGQHRKSNEISYKVVNTEGSIQFGEILSHSEPKLAVSEVENVPEASLSDSKQTVKASTPETRDVTLAWDDVPNATSYNIYWSDKPGTSKRYRKKISNVTNPHKLAGLIKGQKYYVVVTAVNASGESEESEEISFTVGQ